MGPRRRWPSIVAALCSGVCACTGGAAGRLAADEALLERGETFRVQGRYEEALEASAGLLFRRGDFLWPRPEALHADLLILLGRQADLDALQEFIARYREDSDRTRNRPADLTERDCERSSPERGRSEGGKLITRFEPRKSGELPRRHRDRPYVVLFDIEQDGTLRNIRVERAFDPAIAWAVIDSIRSAELNRTFLARLEPRLFPIRYCYWRKTPRLDPATLRSLGS